MPSVPALPLCAWVRWQDALWLRCVIEQGESASEYPTFLRRIEMKFDFEKWLEDNQHIWQAFEKQALLTAQRGFKHYSARTIVHFLRHHSAMTETSGEWKINNNVSPYLARKFMQKYPSFAGFFETRGIK